MVNNFIIHVLGTAQDGGYPHAGCKDICCLDIWDKPSSHRLPSSIAVVDKKNKKFYLFDITPNIKEQLHFLDKYNCKLDGIFITHAHLGHYIGLLDLGLEIMNTDNIPVYVMPRMKQFIFNNEPMAQLIKNNNIQLIALENDCDILLNNLSITPFEVPHRNELSETVGFRIKNSNKSVIYLPDIDDWDSWSVNLEDLVINNNILFLDGTFYTKNEIKLRDISKIPHPDILDTISRLSNLSLDYKKRIYFIHFNHTNDVIRHNTTAYKHVVDSGFLLANEQQIIQL